jgi:hypothetical protein
MFPICYVNTEASVTTCCLVPAWDTNMWADIAESWGLIQCNLVGARRYKGIVPFKGDTIKAFEVKMTENPIVVGV